MVRVSIILFAGNELVPHYSFEKAGFRVRLFSLFGGCYVVRVSRQSQIVMFDFHHGSYDWNGVSVSAIECCTALDANKLEISSRRFAFCHAVSVPGHMCDVANYLAKIGELFGNRQGVPRSKLLRATSTTSGVIIAKQFSF